jgi:hypothetical protein
VTGRPGVRAGQWAALLVGALALALTVAEVPLAGLARQSVLASGGSLPFPFTLAYGVAGLLVAWRKPGNIIGWLMLGAAAAGAASESASFYTVADYRLHGGQLPAGWLAVLAQPGWAPCIVALGRARYDADRMVAGFAASLQDAVDLDLVRAGLADTVRVALEPAHVSVWLRGGAG